MSDLLDTLFLISSLKILKFLSFCSLNLHFFNLVFKEFKNRERGMKGDDIAETFRDTPKLYTSSRNESNSFISSVCLVRNTPIIIASPTAASAAAIAITKRAST